MKDRSQIPNTESGKFSPWLAKFALYFSISAFFALSTWHCGSKPRAEIRPALLVVYSVGPTYIVRDGRESRASAGKILTAQDGARTGKGGTMDLQTRNGSIIRLKPETSIRVDLLAGRDGGPRKIHLQKGAVFASTRKISRRNSFIVTTPTAIAGVRGTVFSVRVNGRGRNPDIRVLEGKIAMGPNLGRMAPAPDARKEFILEKNDRGKFHPEFEKKIELVQKKTDASRDASLLSNPSGAKAFARNKFRPSREDKIDRSTVLALNENDFDRIREKENAYSGNALEDLSRRREEKRKEVLESLDPKPKAKTYRAFTPRKSRRVFRKETTLDYRKIVYIRLKSGKRISGYVLARNPDGSLVLQTGKGARLLKKEELSREPAR